MIRTFAIAGILAVAAASPGFGEEVVHFQNGQAMRVEKTRREGRWLFLELGDEGEMAVLLRQVSKVEEAEPLAGGGARNSAAANVVSAAGGGRGRGRGRATAGRRGAVAQSYGSSRGSTQAGAEPQAAPEPQEVTTAAPAATPAAAQGRDLVPRSQRRGGRRNVNRPPQQ